MFNTDPISANIHIAASHKGTTGKFTTTLRLKKRLDGSHKQSKRGRDNSSARLIMSARVAVIGGSGFYNLDGFRTVEEVNPETPWGFPSSPITIAASSTGFRVAFLARHGKGHHLLPTEVPSRANMAALKSLGVEVILAFSAVGSLREHIAPEDFVVPTQIIDRTKGLRPGTFFGDGVVAHAMFGEPFSTALTDLLASGEFADVLGHGKRLHTASSGGEEDLTLVCMEGPQFSTRAESHLYRSWGGMVINMSALPEAKLARECEMAYAMICMATDYDCWRVSTVPVTVEEVMTHVKNNTENAHRLAERVIHSLEARMADGARVGDLRGSMKFAVMTKPEDRPKEAVDKLEYILPGYYS